MNRDYILIIIQCIITIALLLKFVPKNKIRKAYVIFSFKQLLTWLLGLSVAELKLIDYPIRLFPYATRTSFTFEYFIYPSICIIFNFHYPKNKSSFIQFMHYFYYCTAMTVIEVLTEKYTNILKYINWTWYITWITLFITFYISRKFYLWFFRLEENS